MAKIILRKGGTQVSDIMAYAKTAADEAYVCGNTPLSNFVFVDMSDSDFDAMSVFTKDLDTIDVANNSATFVDIPADFFDEVDVDEENFKTNLQDWKTTLSKRIANRPNQSNHAAAVACLDYLNTIDLSTMSYPTTQIIKKCLVNGTPVNLACL